MSNYNGQFQDTGANILLPTPHSYANIEGSTASQAYVKGQMLVYNNRLCQVIAPISSGNTLTIGTNIAYKNVGDIGKQLVASDGKGFYFDVKDGSYGFYPSASKVASEFVPFGGSIDNPDRVTYSGVYGVTRAFGSYTVGGTTTLFDMGSGDVKDFPGLFCTISGYGTIIYKVAGTYLEMGAGSARSVSQTVDRAVGDTCTVALSGSNAFSIAIAKLS